MGDSESCSSRATEWSPCQCRERGLKVEVFQEVQHRLKELEVEEAVEPGFEDELWAHFCMLPLQPYVDRYWHPNVDRYWHPNPAWLLDDNFVNHLQAIDCNMKKFIQLQETPPIRGPKAAKVCGPMQEVFFPSNAPMHVKAQQANLVPKDEKGRWTSVKHKQASKQLWKLEIGTISDNEEFSFKEVKEETARILGNARNRKRKHIITIIIN